MWIGETLMSDVVPQLVSIRLRDPDEFIAGASIKTQIPGN